MADLTQQELEAAIGELEAALTDAGPELRATLVAQLASLRQTLAMLAAAAPAMAAARAARRPLTADSAAWFRPRPPVVVPAWVPDDVTRAAVTPALMRCPTGARLYEDATTVACANAGVAGATLSVPHGLTLRFDPGGGLASQSWYERGCLRWEIRYHANGARAELGAYVGVEPKTYVEHGVHTRWAANGVVVAQTDWRDGVRDGWSTLWEDDGYPIVATRFAGGVEVERVMPDVAEG